jgi:deazaflavin-dependent oxidoreductase (nitroreductase family)
MQISEHRATRVPSAGRGRIESQVYLRGSSYLPELLGLADRVLVLRLPAVAVDVHRRQERRPARQPGGLIRHRRQDVYRWLRSRPEGNPGWVFNVRAKPNVTVDIGSDPPKTVVALDLPRDERDRIYAVIVQRAPGFGEYEERTDRVIPVFELTPDG